jgi:ubiquinone/menaquinone biosynthesis C-methylase UbiE
MKSDVVSNQNDRQMDRKIDTSSKPIGTREWYDFVGQLADTIPGIHMGGQDATRTLLEMCKIDATKRILDVGCGAGHTACLIAEQYGTHVYGIDISEVMIAKANERAGRMGLTDRVEFRTADAYQLPFDDGQFDVVLIESVLTPLPGDKLLALQEMTRVLRPGGLIGANETTVDPAAPASGHLRAFHPRFSAETVRTGRIAGASNGGSEECGRAKPPQGNGLWRLSGFYDPSLSQDHPHAIARCAVQRSKPH